MTDVSERPAVSPEDPGGDERAGLFIAGGLFLFLGWGVALLLNVYLHMTAASSGTPFLWWVVFPSYGPYASAVAAAGVLGGFVGIVLVGLARAEPKGSIKLPGTAY